MKLPLPAEQGVIHGDTVYSLAAFMDRLGVGEAWLRARRREGLRVCYVGKQGFIAGEDFLEFLIRSHTAACGDAAIGVRK